MAFNNFLEGVATQLTNTALRKVAGNVPGFNLQNRGGNTSDTIPLAPSRNLNYLSFPLDVTADPGLGNQGHYMLFYINEQENAKIRFGERNNAVVKPQSTTFDNLDHLNSAFEKVRTGAGGNLESRFRKGSTFYNTQAAKLKKVGMVRAPTKRLHTAIAMYMPAQVSTTYGAQYTDTEMGSITGAALDAYDRVATGQVADAVGALSGVLPEVAKNINNLLLVTAGALPGLGGLREAAEARRGYITSNRMELAFKGIDKRTFQYDFKMIPKSEEEAKEVRSIVKMFKVNMLPEYLGDDVVGRSLTIPNTFDIEYIWNGAENRFLHKIATCFLENMSVTYGGDRYKTYQGIDGDGAPPIETNISLTFKEIDLITRKEADEGF